MLFDPEPKTKIEDLYNFRDVLKKLIDLIPKTRMFIVSGLRRTGKTSLIKVALNNLSLPYIYIDTRLTFYTSYYDIVKVIAKAIEDF